MSGEITEKITYVDAQRMLANEEADPTSGVCKEIQVTLVTSRILAENYEYSKNISEFPYARQRGERRSLNADEEGVTTGRNKEQSGILHNLNQRRNRFCLTDVRESNLLRRRREKRSLNESKTEKGGPVEITLSEVASFQDQETISAPQITLPLDEFGDVLSPGPSPRDQSNMGSSFEKKFSGRATRDRDEIGSSFLSLKLPSSDESEVGSSSPENVLGHSPQISPCLRIEMVTKFEELVIIHSPRGRERSKSLLD